MIKGYFGMPGCGKSTLLAKYAEKELKKLRRGKSKYKHVLTNFYVKGAEKLRLEDCGKKSIEDSLILIDEITLFFDSRDFKKFDQEKKYFFLWHRHCGNDIIYFTQQWDGVDKKIRDITPELYHVKKIAWWTRATKIFRILTINEQTKDIVQGYRFPVFIERIMALFFKFMLMGNALKLHEWTFRPFWYKYFDSWCPPPIEDDYVYVPWDAPVGPQPLGRPEDAETD